MTTEIRQTLSTEVGEGSNATLIAYYEDGAGNYIPVAGFSSIRFWLDNLTTGLTINGRANIEIKNVNGGVLAEVLETVNGVQKTRTKLTLTLVPADNPILDSTLRSEWHLATLKGFYNSGAGMVPKEALFKVVNMVRTP